MISIFLEEVSFQYNLTTKEIVGRQRERIIRLSYDICNFGQVQSYFCWIILLTLKVLASITSYDYKQRNEQMELKNSTEAGVVFNF